MSCIAIVSFCHNISLFLKGISFHHCCVGGSDKDRRLIIALTYELISSWSSFPSYGCVLQIWFFLYIQLKLLSRISTFHPDSAASFLWPWILPCWYPYRLFCCFDHVSLIQEQIHRGHGSLVIPPFPWCSPSGLVSYSPGHLVFPPVRQQAQGGGACPLLVLSQLSLLPLQSRPEWDRIGWDCSYSW